MEFINDFDKLCTQIFYYNNKFQFPFDSIKHDANFQDILNKESYSVLESKMTNLIDLINNDQSKLQEDTIDLWELI
jgi:hypothetical protein